MSSGALREEGQPIRYPSTALFCVNTNDGFRRLPGTEEVIEGPNPARININLQRTLVSGYIKRIALTEVNIQWNIGNVNNLNNNLTLQIFNQLGVSQGFVRVFPLITAEFLQPAELILALQLALNNEPAIVGYFTPLGVTDPFEVFMPTFSGAAVIGATGPSGSGNNTFTTNNPQVVIQLTTAASAVANFNIISSRASTNITGLPSLQDDLTGMLGLTPTNGGSKLYTSYRGAYASFQYTPYIDILSRTLCGNQTIADSDTSQRQTPQKLARIYLSNENIEPFFASATYNNAGQLVGSESNVVGVSPFVFRRAFAFPKQIAWNTRINIDNVELELIDSRGNYLPIKFQNKFSGNTDEKDSIDMADFELTLQVSEI